MSEYEIIGTEGRFAIAALNYLQVSSTDTDLVGSKESLPNGGDRSKGVNEADTASFARSYGDCFQRTILSKSARLGRDSVTIPFSSSVVAAVADGLRSLLQTIEPRLDGPYQLQS